MLISFIGIHNQEREKKIKEIKEGLKKKRPDSLFIHYDFLDLSENKLEEILNSGESLFDEKNIYFLSNIFQKEKIKKIFFENLDKIKDSPDAFILSEGLLPDREAEKIRKFSFKFFFFEKTEKEYNFFIISDLLQKKDKKNLWLEFHKALIIEKAHESQIYDKLFFALKGLVLAEKFNLKESGLKNFPYQKAKKNLIKWKEGEPEEKIFQLISIYNNSRNGKIDLKYYLEKFILEL